MVNIEKILEDAEKEHDEIMAELAPLRAEEAKLMKQFAPLDIKLREVRQKCADIEKTKDLAGVRKTIVALGRSKPGGKSITAESGHFEKT